MPIGIFEHGTENEHFLCLLGAVVCAYCKYYEAVFILFHTGMRISM